MTTSHALVDTTFVQEHTVAFVRAEKDGSYRIADGLDLYDQLEGMLPAAGDFLTTAYDDGMAFSVQIIARHRVQFPERKDVCWCLVFKDVEETADLAGLYSCLVDLRTPRKPRT